MRIPGKKVAARAIRTGRAVGRTETARRVGLTALTAGAVGGGIVNGMGTASWRDTGSHMLASPDMVSTSFAAGVNQGFNKSFSTNDVYGSPRDINRRSMNSNSFRNAPVTGDIVFGMHNLRR